MIRAILIPQATFSSINCSCFISFCVHDPRDRGVWYNINNKNKINNNNNNSNNNRSSSSSSDSSSKKARDTLLSRLSLLSAFSEEYDRRSSRKWQFPFTAIVPTTWWAGSRRWLFWAPCVCSGCTIRANPVITNHQGFGEHGGATGCLALSQSCRTPLWLRSPISRNKNNDDDDNINNSSSSNKYSLLPLFGTWLEIQIPVIKEWLITHSSTSDIITKTRRSASKRELRYVS